MENSISKIYYAHDARLSVTGKILLEKTDVFMSFGQGTFHWHFSLWGACLILIFVFCFISVSYL